MKVDEWIAALQERHRAHLTSAEFLKAVRALSVRYVERRAGLSDRSVLDSAGKRAAFAAFYAPLHFLTVRAIVQAQQAARQVSPVALRTIFDLGCGSGVASAAWSLELASLANLVGIDAHAWALDEARWNWRRLELAGRTSRGDLVLGLDRWLTREARRTQPSEGALGHTGIVAGWSVNELSKSSRDRLLPLLLQAAERGAGVLVIEPLAGSATPWWREWETSVTARGGLAERWRFDAPLPEPLRIVSEAAGFQREALTAKTFRLN